MDSPFAFQPDKPVVTIGKIFGTPIAVQGLSWLPVSQVFFWALFTWQSVKSRKAWSAWQYVVLGGLKMVVVLGSEWCHNIAHVAAARAIGKPVDAMRVVLGMPLLLYDEPEHPTITPRQHILRSLGGPVFNVLFLLVSKIIRGFTSPGSAAREVTDACAGMNAFITGASLIPVPVFDGGPILKWALISRGFTPTQASTVTTWANRFIGMGLAGATAVSIHKRAWLMAFIFSLMGALCLAFGFGKQKSITSKYANR